jgi:D-alanyl-D-alanine carboxypeptidase
VSLTRSRCARLVVTATLVLAAASCSGDDSSDDVTPGEPDEQWSGPAPTDDEMSEDDVAELDRRAAEGIANSDGDLPGMWVGVWSSERGSYVGAYGDAIVEQAAATPEDHARIGGLTMTFTATAVLREVDAGELALDDTVADHLPDLAEEHDDLAAITVEQLLGMTSGLPDYASAGWFLAEVVDDPARVWSAGEIIDEVVARGGLEEPGTPRYSTTNYLVLGAIVSAVTGAEVDRVLTTMATDAGLDQTALPPRTDDGLVAPAAHGYVNAAGNRDLTDVIGDAGDAPPVGTDVTRWDLSWAGAGGQMYSTVADLGAWAADGLGSTELTNATVDERLDTTDVPGAGAYGLGIIDFGNGWIGHTGQVIGWSALAAYNVRTGEVFVGLVNETSALPALAGVVAYEFPDLAEGLFPG